MHVSLPDRIFRKWRHCVTVEGQVQGRFDSAELEDAIKEIVVKQGEDILTSGVQVRVCDEQGDRRRGSTYQLPLATRPRTTAPHDQDLGSRPGNVGSIVVLRSDYHRRLLGEFCRRRYRREQPGCTRCGTKRDRIITSSDLEILERWGKHAQEKREWAQG